MNFINSKTITAAAFIISLFTSSYAFAQAIPLAQSPMLTLKSAPGLVMLTMGRDLPLSKAAYNDVIRYIAEQTGGQGIEHEPPYRDLVGLSDLSGVTGRGVVVTRCARGEGLCRATQRDAGPSKPLPPRGLPFVASSSSTRERRGPACPSVLM